MDSAGEVRSRAGTYEEASLFESVVGNMCILRGPGAASGRAAPRGTRTSYACEFGECIRDVKTIWRFVMQ